MSVGSQVTGIGRRVQGHPVGGWRWRGWGGVGGEMFKANTAQTGIILEERAPTKKVPTSLHLIFICIKSLIYIHATSTLGFSITHSLLISIYSSFPLLSFTLYFSASLLLSICLSCHSIRRSAEGGLMASLSGVLASVLLQLLGGHIGSIS